MSMGHPCLTSPLRGTWHRKPFRPIIRLNRDTREREIVMMRWDPIPYWILLANSEAAPEVSENRTLQVFSEKRLFGPLAKR